MVVYSLVSRFFFSPQPFFRVNAFCWAVDDDCHHSQGRRREAVHAGVVKLFEEEGRAVTILLLLGLGSLGMRARNCELHCKAAPDRSGCVRGCELEDIAGQPAPVLECILLVMTYVVPALGLLTAFHIWRSEGDEMRGIQGRRLIARRL